MNWEDSELRQWLNGEFYNTSFTEDEQSRKNSEISYNAVAEYRDGDKSNWWLRTTGYDEGTTFAMAVVSNGELVGGYCVDADKGV